MRLIIYNACSSFKMKISSRCMVYYAFLRIMYCMVYEDTVQNWNRFIDANLPRKSTNQY